MSGLMLATVITGMLVKFGGHALATMGSGLLGQVQNAGQQAAQMTENPSGRAAALKSNAGPCQQRQSPTITVMDIKA